MTEFQMNNESMDACAHAIGKTISKGQLEWLYKQHFRINICVKQFPEKVIG